MATYFGSILFLLRTLLIAISCGHKVVQCFLIQCIQNLLQMIMAQDFLHGGGARI